MEGEYINVNRFLTETNPSEIKFENHDISHPTGSKITLTHQERYGNVGTSINFVNNAIKSKPQVTPIFSLKSSRLFNGKK